MQRPKKFTIQQKVQDFTSKIGYVLDRSKCDIHRADFDEPCHVIEMDNGFSGLAICGNRSRKVFSGSVSDTRTKRS